MWACLAADMDGKQAAKHCILAALIIREYSFAIGSSRSHDAMALGECEDVR